MVERLKEFESLLHQALAINPDAKPEWRLANLVTQRRAKWLLSRTDQLFLRASPAGDGKPKPETRNSKPDPLRRRDSAARGSQKSETRKVSANHQLARGHESGMSPCAAACQPWLPIPPCSRIGDCRLRTSAFGLLSAFGLRASDFRGQARAEWQGRLPRESV